MWQCCSLVSSPGVIVKQARDEKMQSEEKENILSDTSLIQVANLPSETALAQGLKSKGD